MNTKKMHLAGLVLAMGLSGAAQAALESRLDGLAVYDTDLNITWLANANLAATNTFGVSGINPTGYMTRATAQSWIEAMNTANYLGYNNWMLPTTLQPDASCGIQVAGVSTGYGCTGSEMGHLFYSELGGVAGSSITTTHNTSYSLFHNVRVDGYWSSTMYSIVSLYGSCVDCAWYFGMDSGNQNWAYGTIGLSAWAVLPGDVALACTDPTCTAVPITPVPEPEAFGLMLSGLALVGWAARRRTSVQIDARKRGKELC
ncbi:MAG: PEP-CTERM sorting domain-containing protein [Thiobacillus sp.]